MAGADDKTSLVRQVHGGECVAGRFTIVKPLYRSNTYQARDGKHHVRIEIVPPTGLEHLRAAVAAAGRLAHPNICRVRELVETDDSCVLVMELVDGVSLADRLLLGALDPAQAGEWLGQLLSALACGHAAGIAHGDVSTKNVVIDASGTLKLLDFGVLGGTAATARSDVRAAGTLAYAMFTGDAGPVRIAAVPAGYRAWVRRCTSAVIPFTTAEAAAAALRSPASSMRAPLAIASAAGALAVGAIALWVARGSTAVANEVPPATTVASAPRPEVEPNRSGRPPLPTGAIAPVEFTADAGPTLDIPSAPRVDLDPVPAVSSTTVLGQVLFSPEAAWIETEAVFVLERVTVHLARNAKIRVELSGHSSGDGKDDENHRLALLRATAVRDYLVNRGIDEARIEIRAHADAKPIATNETANGRALNRRVEIRGRADPSAATTSRSLR